MKKVRFASHLKAKVTRHGPPGSARTHPGLVIHVFNNINCGIQTVDVYSDFVTNSYGESWD